MYQTYLLIIFKNLSDTTPDNRMIICYQNSYHGQNLIYNGKVNLITVPSPLIPLTDTFPFTEFTRSRMPANPKDVEELILLSSIPIPLSLIINDILVFF